MAENTGRVIFENLKQVYMDTGLDTGEADKPNDPDDPDYIQPQVDLESCPLPEAEEVFINKLNITIVNSSSQAITLSNVLFKQEAVVGPDYYSSTLLNILPGRSYELSIKNQFDDFTRVKFFLHAASFGIRVKASTQYKMSTEPTYAIGYENDMVPSSLQDLPVSTPMVPSSNGTNYLKVVFTNNP